MRQGAGADAVHQSHRFLFGLPLIHIEHAVAVQQRQPRRLPRQPGQAFQFGRGGGAQVEAVPDAMRHFHQARTEGEGLACGVVAQQPRFRQRGEDAVRGGARQAGAFRDLGEAQRCCGVGDQVEQRDAARQRLGAGDGPGILLGVGLARAWRHGSPGVRPLTRPNSVHIVEPSSRTDKTAERNTEEVPCEPPVAMP